VNKKEENDLNSRPWIRCNPELLRIAMDLGCSSKPILVLAGNYQQYREYIREHKLDSKRYVWMDDHAHNAMGREFAALIAIGTFFDRPDAGKQYSYANSRVR